MGHGQHYFPSGDGAAKDLGDGVGVEESFVNGVRYLDMTPTLVLGLMAVVAGRYIASGTNSNELCILSGIGIALLIGVRLLMFKTQMIVISALSPASARAARKLLHVLGQGLGSELQALAKARQGKKSGLA